MESCLQGMQVPSRAVTVFKLSAVYTEKQMNTYFKRACLMACKLSFKNTNQKAERNSTK